MISKEIKLEFIRENEKLIVTGTDTTDYRLVTISGIDTIPIERQYSANPYLDGSIVINSRAVNRQIDLRILTLESKRETILNMFLPKEKGLLTVTRDGISRQINYWVEGTPSPPEHIHPLIYYDIRLLCTDPWFRDVDSFGKNLAAIKPRHGFPLLWLVGKGYAIEEKTISTKTGLVNNGHDVAPFTCRIKSREKVVNPSISTVNKRGETLTIKVNVTLNANEFIDIVSHDYPPAYTNVPLLDKNQTAVAIILNGTKNIIDRTDIRNTTFFVLERGVNEFEYTADEGISYMDVYPQFRGRYIGV